MYVGFSLAPDLLLVARSVGCGPRHIHCGQARLGEGWGGGSSVGLHSPILLADRGARAPAPRMFVISEAEAAAIRAIFDQRGELSATVELRRLFPAITDNVQARERARTIASWKPLPSAPPPVRRLHQGRGKKP
jgi:hypothetical protein